MAPRSILTIGNMVGSACYRHTFHTSPSQTDVSRTLVQQPQGGVERSIEMLEEKRFSVQRVDGDVLSAKRHNACVKDQVQP